VGKHLRVDTEIIAGIVPELTSIYSDPHAFIDKRGNPILIKPLSEKRHDQLEQMYLGYGPRGSFSGLPPINDKACVDWVQTMIRTGINLVSLSFEEGIIGHTAIFPMDAKRCEMFVVVAPGHQNTGIGTQLTRCVVQLAYELEFERIWLSVEHTNQIARHVYQKCGFEYITHSQVNEMDMILDLRRFHHMTGITVGDVMKTEVVSVHERVSCQRAIESFLENHVASLPVVDDNNEIVGILTETDMMMVGSQDHRVHDILTRHVISVGPDCSFSKVVRLFNSRKVRCIPVVDENKKLLGIIGRREVLAYYAKTLNPNSYSDTD